MSDSLSVCLVQRDDEADGASGGVGGVGLGLKRRQQQWLLGGGGDQRRVDIPAHGSSRERQRQRRDNDDNNDDNNDEDDGGSLRSSQPLLSQFNGGGRGGQEGAAAEAQQSISVISVIAFSFKWALVSLSRSVGSAMSRRQRLDDANNASTLRDHGGQSQPLPSALSVAALVARGGRRRRDVVSADW